jgi:hypothetical protein
LWPRADLAVSPDFLRELNRKKARIVQQKGHNFYKIANFVANRLSNDPKIISARQKLHPPSGPIGHGGGIARPDGGRIESFLHPGV